MILTIILCSIPFLMLAGWFIEDRISKAKRKRMEEAEKNKEEIRHLEDAIEKGHRKVELLNIMMWANIFALHSDCELPSLDICDEWIKDVFSEPHYGDWFDPCKIRYRTFDREDWLYFRPFKASDGCYYYFGVRKTEIRSGDAYLFCIECFLRPEDTKPLWPYRQCRVYPLYMIDTTNDMYSLKKEFRNYTFERWGRKD